MRLTGPSGFFVLGDPGNPKVLRFKITSWSATLEPQPRPARRPLREPSGSMELAVTYDPTGCRELILLIAADLPCDSLDGLVRALECRRWLSWGGPLASWYRGRPGFRVADDVEGGRN